jgi:hypothetical protein
MKPSFQFALKFALVSLLGLTSIGCNSASSLYHSYMMRGSIVDVVNEREVVLCIGSNDGAKPGQVLRVFRTTYIEDGAGEIYAYGRVDVGNVRIQSVIDEHYARAEILKGELARHDHVELLEEP